MDKNILNSLFKSDKDDILQALYEYRENQDDIITPEFKEELRVAQKAKRYRYNRFEEELKKQVSNNEQVSKIISLFDQYEDEYNNEHGLYYEQYYKEGVKDILKLLLQCLL
ncbi:MAG: hypothetical protein HFJ57_00490 [Clostridia bacterium]|nr:hypothetical protein [Clostridia bacterium]